MSGRCPLEMQQYAEPIFPLPCGVCHYIKARHLK
uniref:Uncharacterized protein n=1 Tax=Ralstonia solanacearum TaxID=305 RepID=A0A0S4WJL2_RALSL|nr:conserved protein of unknown function [Ralstonia solanacearum]